MKTLALWTACLAIAIGVGAMHDGIDADQLTADTVLDAQHAARAARADHSDRVAALEARQ